MISRQDFVKRWSKALESRAASVFIGAGISMAAGYPDWRMLLRDIASDLGLNIADEHDLAAVAQYSVNRSAGNRNKLKRAIADSFPPKPTPPETLAILARLPLRHLWTTNYDLLIESAWTLERKQIDVKSRNDDLGHEMPWAHSILYKMHGTVSHAADVVIAKDDYELYRQMRPAFLHLLTGHLVSMQMLFLGFSFTDPNLAHLFSSIRESFKSGGPNHYAIVRKPQRKGKSIAATKAYKTDTIRHNLWIEDLQRYGIDCVEIDEFAEIPDILRDVELQLARNSVLVSGSFPTAPPASLVSQKEFIENVAQLIGTEIAKRQKRLVSGFGLVVGSSAMTGALQVALREKTPNLERSLLLRPFPRDVPDGMDKKEFQMLYREAMVRQAGTCVFISGFKEKDGKFVIGSGTIEEFERAKKIGRVCIPIGSTGHAAFDIWSQLNAMWPDASSPYPRKLFDRLNERLEPVEVAKTVGSILDSLDQI